VAVFAFDLGVGFTDHSDVPPVGLDDDALLFGVGFTADVRVEKLVTGFTWLGRGLPSMCHN